MTATVTPIGLAVDASRLALDMVAANAGTVTDRRWTRAMLNLCCEGIATAMRGARGCDCSEEGWALEVLHLPARLSLSVHPHHAAECRALTPLSLIHI